MTTDTMRAEFEAWAKHHGMDSRPHKDGKYWPDVELAWLAFQFAWQASEREHQRENFHTFLLKHAGLYSGETERAILGLAECYAPHTAAQQET